jgi:hypothetical protein
MPHTNRAGRSDLMASKTTPALRRLERHNLTDPPSVMPRLVSPSERQKRRAKTKAAKQARKRGR